MNARLLVALVLLLGGTALAAPLPFPKPAKKKAKLDLPDALQGIWEVKSRTMNGGVNMGIVSTQKFVKIEGNNWTFLRTDKTPSMQCEMTLAHGNKPAHLDLGFPTAIGGIAGGRIALAGPYMCGIVEVEGDKMKFCYALRGERPNEFKPINPREYLFTLERVVTDEVAPIKKR